MKVISLAEAQMKLGEYGELCYEEAILVSVDGTRAALQAVVDGKLLATVESNPRFGPKAFETMMRYARGERIEPWVVIPDRLFDKSNAAQLIADAY